MEYQESTVFYSQKPCAVIQRQRRAAFRDAGLVTVEIIVKRELSARLRRCAKVFTGGDIEKAERLLCAMESFLENLQAKSANSNKK